MGRRPGPWAPRRRDKVMPGLGLWKHPLILFFSSLPLSLSITECLCLFLSIFLLPCVFMSLSPTLFSLFFFLAFPLPAPLINF